MARFLFSTAPYPGHLDWGGLLETAQCLIQRGHDVLWATGKSASSYLVRQGIPFVEVPVAYPGEKWRPPPPQSLQRMSFGAIYATQMQMLVDLWLDEQQVAAASDAHMALIDAWHPDVVIAEPFVLGAALAAEAHGLPLVGCGYPGPFTVFSSFPEVRAVADEFQHRRNRLRIRLGLSPFPWEPTPAFLFVSDTLHLVYFSETWFATFNPRPSARARFVGGIARTPRTPPPNWLSACDGPSPWILIARPTGYQSNNTSLQPIFDALKRLGIQGIVTGVSENVNEWPSHIMAMRWAPYAHLLPRVAAIIHHGGTGTTHDAICWGIPQLVIPEAVDQWLHARSVEANGVGIQLRPPERTVDHFVNALDRLVHDPCFRQTAEHVRRQFAALGGVERAATLLEQVTCSLSPN